MKNAALILAFVVAVFTSSGSALAESKCDTLFSTYEVATCFNEEYLAADAALNAAYKQRRAGIDETEQKLLRDAQRAWIKFRDAECLLAADASRGGSGAAIDGLRCQIKLTKRRTTDLGG